MCVGAGPNAERSGAIEIHAGRQFAGESADNQHIVCRGNVGRPVLLLPVLDQLARNLVELLGDHGNVVQRFAGYRDTVLVATIALHLDEFVTAELTDQPREAGGILFAEEVFLDVKGEPAGHANQIEGLQESRRRDVTVPQRRDRGEAVEVLLAEDLLVRFGEIRQIGDQVTIVDGGTIPFVALRADGVISTPKT